MPRNFKFVLPVLLAAFMILSQQPSAMASPWSRKPGYGQKTWGKFKFGLQHTLFSWVMMWTESREPQYQVEFQGFCTGVGKTVVNTAAGMIQLVTFPIPVDFPDIGLGIHIPNKECPMRHDPNYVPPAANPPKKGKPVDEPFKLTAPPLALAPPEPSPEPSPEPAIVEAKTDEPVPGVPVPAEEELETEPSPAPSPSPSPSPSPVVLEVKKLEKLHPGELDAEETEEARKAETGTPLPDVKDEAEQAEEQTTGEDAGGMDSDELLALDKEMDAFFAKEADKKTAAS